MLFACLLIRIGIELSEEVPWLWRTEAPCGSMRLGIYQPASVGLDQYIDSTPYVGQHIM